MISPGNIRQSSRLLLAGVLFFVTLELSARVDDRLRFEAPIWGTYTADGIRASDEEGIPINLPNARFEKYENNSSGFRGPEITTDKVDGTQRIICLGASETYGLYESAGMEWPAQLRNALPDSARAEVVNVATAGLPFRHYQRYMEKYVMPLDPDVVVVLASPHAFASGSIRRSFKEVDAAPEHSAQQPAKSGVDRSGFSLRVLPKAKTLLKTFLPEQIRSAIQLRAARKQMEAARSQLLRYSRPIDEVPSDVVEDYERTLRSLVEYLQARGIRVILTIYPTLLNKDNSDDFPYISIESLRFFVELSSEGVWNADRSLSEINRIVAAEMKTGLIDLDSSVPKRLQFFADNVHYTDEGAGLVAELVARGLAER